LLITVCFLIGCRNGSDKANHTTEWNGYECIISHQAGERLQESSQDHLATFFNLGYINNGDTNSQCEVIILAPRLALKSKIKIKPLALFSFNRDSIIKEFVIAKPWKNTSLKADFNALDIETQLLIENWFQLNCAIGLCNNYHWSNAFKAELKINSD